MFILNNKIMKLLKTLFTKGLIFFIPLIIIYSDDKHLGLRQKMQFILEAFTKMSFFLWIYSYFQLWYNNNQVFSASLGGVLLMNMIIGMTLHYKLGTFSWLELFKSTIKMLLVIAAVYIALKALENLLVDSFIGGLFKNFVEIITVFYPASKVLENTFILTNGKYPPEFIIKALYNYRKDGKLKDFFDTLQGKGSKENLEEVSNN